MKKLLWIGDAGCPSGFAKATHQILDALDYRLGGEYEVTVLGLNYRGDPDVRRLYPYDIWECLPGGDYFGVGRLIWMCDRVKPDVIVIQNDGWNISPYVERLKARKSNGEYFFPEHAKVPVVAVVAVDGKNFQGEWLKDVDLAIFWTQFALDEAREGGYKGPAAVIPLGVDLSVYRPMDKMEVRRKRLPEVLHDAFIVGNVNRNQPRKRWDLMVKYFAAWIKEAKIDDAFLFLHTAPTGDTGCDVKGLARYYGVADRLATVMPDTFYDGLTELDMAETYNCFDVNASTTQGEGMGLTALEAMACGVPNVLPGWAALGDWARGAAWLVPCPTTVIGPPYVNVIGGVPDEREFIKALNRMYTDKKARETNGQAALERAHEPRFRWSNIGRLYVGALKAVLEPEAAPHKPSQVELDDIFRPEEVSA